MGKCKTLLVNSQRWLCLDDLPNEQWNIVKGFNEMYYISSYGRVKSYNRYSQGKILQQNIAGNNGYLFVNLYIGHKRYPTTVHRLVAIAFAKNPNNFPIVMHADDNKQNNCSSNLLWGTYSKNIQSAYNNGLHTSRQRAIIQIDNDGNIIAEHISISSASKKLNIAPSTISECLSGRNKTAAGYKWIYKK